MPHYTYLLVGGGIAADAALRGLREIDAEGPALLLGDEPHPPYDRPPLSKELWGGLEEERIWRGTAELGVELRLGRRAVHLDPASRTVVDDRGDRYTYGALLLATGARARSLPGAPEGVLYLRTLDDYRRIRAAADDGRSFVVIGGGFVGSELAAVLATAGCRVDMVFAEDAIGGLFLPPDLAAHLNGEYRARGVRVWPGERAVHVERRGDGFRILTSGGQELRAQELVAGLGAVPNSELAMDAGLPVENGIAADELLRAGHPDVYAAGDVASYPSRVLGKRVRAEHEDNANRMGAHAGRAMAGEAAPYDHVPFVYSDLFDLHYRALGELDPRMEMVADWREPLRAGVVYYLAGGRVRGVLLWNTPPKLVATRKLIASPGPFRPEELIGRLPT